MKVGILLVTHSDIGKQLLLTATSVFGKNPFQVELLSVDNYDQPNDVCLLYTSPSPRDATLSRMPSSA